VTNFASHLDLADEEMPSLAMLSHGKQHYYMMQFTCLTYLTRVNNAHGSCLSK